MEQKKIGGGVIALYSTAIRANGALCGAQPHTSYKEALSLTSACSVVIAFQALAQNAYLRRRVLRLHF